MFVEKTLSGGSIVCRETRQIATVGPLAGKSVLSGKRFQIPSLKYLFDGDEETVDLINEFTSSLSKGDDVSDWAKAGDTQVVLTVAKDGTPLDNPRMLNRWYATIDLDELSDAIGDFQDGVQETPAPAAAKRNKKQNA